MEVVAILCEGGFVPRDLIEDIRLDTTDEKRFVTLLKSMARQGQASYFAFIDHMNKKYGFPNPISTSKSDIINIEM